MEQKIIFSKDLLKAMQNAMDVAEYYDIERSTPVVIFKGLLDLETSPIYDYLIDNTYSENDSIELGFEDTISFFISDKEEIQDSETENEEDNKYCFIDDDTKKTLFYTEEVAILISRAIQIAQEAEAEMVQVEHLSNAIAENIPKDILTFLRKLGGKY